MLRGRMKQAGRVCALLALVWFAASCVAQGANKTTTAAAKAANCMNCHGDGVSGEAMQAAREKHQVSSHFLGFRTPTAPGSAQPAEFRDVTDEATQDAIPSHPESMGCMGCHTDQGFRERVKTGKSNGLTPVANPVRIGCFTCHQPHTRGDFSLTTTKPVPSLARTNGIAGKTFDGGKGNLCAMCHRLTLSMPDGLVKLWNGKGKDEPLVVAVNVFGHQPHEADFMLGQGNWPFDSNYDGTGKPLAYETANAHYLTVQDTCVGCHKTVPGETGGMAGHSFFLSNYRRDLTSGCESCHTDAFKKKAEQGAGPVLHFRDGKIDVAEALVDYDGNGKAEQLLVEIEGMRNTLVDYFITPANFPNPNSSAPPAAALRKLVNLDPPGTMQPTPLKNYNVYSDFRTNAGPQIAFKRAQAQSFYNLRMILFDNSRGIHNPRFAAQVLFDSIQNLNVNLHAGLKVGAKRP